MKAALAPPTSLLEPVAGRAPDAPAGATTIHARPGDGDLAYLIRRWDVLTVTGRFRNAAGEGVEDRMLRTEVFFRAERFPSLSFVSTAVARCSGPTSRAASSSLPRRGRPAERAAGEVPARDDRRGAGERRRKERGPMRDSPHRAKGSASVG